MIRKKKIEETIPDPIVLASGNIIRYTDINENSTIEEKPPLKRSQSNNPIVAYKSINTDYVVFCNGGYYFWIPGRNPYRGSESWASCDAYAPGMKSIDHMLTCHCGFHAWKTQEDSLRYISAGVQLEVELFGTVIEHENGYRAEKQRVLSATFSRRCYLCPNIPTKFGYKNDPFVYNPSINDSYGFTLSGDYGNQLVFLCDEHAPFKTPHTEVSRLGELLGTEIRWI